MKSKLSFKEALLVSLLLAAHQQGLQRNPDKREYLHVLTKDNSE